MIFYLKKKIIICVEWVSDTVTQHVRDHANKDYSQNNTEI